MKNFLLLALACALPAQAQTHMDMPEGSKDIYLSLGMANGPSSEGSAQRETFVAPLISVQWANGVFINMNVVGMHLSERSDMSYGPLFAPTRTRAASLGAAGARTGSRFTPEAGGFFNYTVSRGLGVESHLMYGGSSDHRGARLSIAPYVHMPLAAHHSLSVQARVQLANRSALQANFAVPGVHEVSGGVRDVGISARWRWELSTKYSLTTALTWERLQGSAAASPRIERRTGTSMVTVLTYHY